MYINPMAPGAISSAAGGCIANWMMRSRPVKAMFTKFMQPVERPGQPEKVAEAVVWLCSELASYVTGHTMLIDGGMKAA